jgi:hypothetical protein
VTYRVSDLEPGTLQARLVISLRFCLAVACRSITTEHRLLSDEETLDLLGVLVDLVDDAGLDSLTVARD